MQADYWHKQGRSAPLFPDLAWSRPENKQFAGKLLIAGGNLHGFAAPAEAFAAAAKAGIGTAHVLLPDAIQKIVGTTLEHAEFAPSTPSGSFSQRALGEVLTHCNWADGVLLAGDFGRNSETAILLEKFLTKCEIATTLTKDAVDYATSAPHSVLERPNTSLVLSLSQLQRLGIAARFEQPVTYTMDLIRLVDWLHDFTARFAPHVIVKHLEHILVAVHGEISTTRLTTDIEIWRLKVAAETSVWWAQNPSLAFEALTAGVYAAVFSEPVQ